MSSFIPDFTHERAFRDALGRFATGVTVVTTAGDDGPLGITANSFAALSLAPPLVLWSPARASSRFPAFARAENYSIHILAADQAEVCRHFTKTGQFDHLDWSHNASGVPVLAGCLARFDCERSAVHEGGDHVIIVGRVTEVVTADLPAAPLVFQSGRFLST